MTIASIHPVSLKTRRLIFWLFFIAFIIFAPILVLYTAGYRYNLESGQIVRTGVISVITDPRGANVSLSGVAYDQKTPTVLKRLLPGQYNVQISKDGYRSMEKKVMAESGQTTILHSLLLLLDSDMETIFSKNLSNIAQSPNGNTIAYALAQGGWEEVWLFDTKNNKHLLVSQEALTLKNDVELSWSAEGGYLGLFSAKKAGIKIFSNSGTAVDTSFIRTGDIEHFSWHPSTDAVIYLSTQVGLLQNDLSDKSSELFTDTDENSILLDASVLNFFDDGTYTELIQSINGNSTLIALLPRSDYSIAKRDGSLMILTDAKNRLLLLDIHADTPILLETTATSFSWLADNNLLVYTDGYEIRTYNSSTHTNQFLIRQSEKIQSVLWHPSRRYIFIQTNSSIVAMELETVQDDRTSFILVENMEITTSWVTQDGEWLYVYGKKDGAFSLFALKLTKSFISL